MPPAGAGALSVIVTLAAPAPSDTDTLVSPLTTNASSSTTVTEPGELSTSAPTPPIRVTVQVWSSCGVALPSIGTSTSWLVTPAGMVTGTSTPSPATAQPSI